MNDKVERATVWHLTAVVPVSTEDMDTVSYALCADTHDYVVMVSSRKGMMTSEHINALRAALAYAIAGAGGSVMEVSGCEIAKRSDLTNHAGKVN